MMENNAVFGDFLATNFSRHKNGSLCSFSENPRFFCAVLGDEKPGKPEDPENVFALKIKIAFSLVFVLFYLRVWVRVSWCQGVIRCQPVLPTIPQFVF